MTGMDQFLSQSYGASAPVSEPTAEDVEKQAQVEFFLKLAAKNGIDVNALNSDQIDSLWGAVFNDKTAEEEPKKEQEAKLEAAKEEHKKAKEEQDKAAEARQLGVIMGETAAEAYVDKLRKMAEAASPPAPAATSGSSLDSLAAQMAVEKAASAGWDTEEAARRVSAVLTLGPGESEKIAHVPDVNSAIDVRSSELLEMAGYPIDWSGTPFEKSAEEVSIPGHTVPRPEGPRTSGVVGGEKAPKDSRLGAHFDIAKAKAKGYGYLAAEKGKKLYRASAEKGKKLYGASAEKGRKLVELAKEHPGKATGAAVGAAAALGGGAYLAHRALKGKKEESSKESSAQFDVAAAELAVKKAEAAGWNSEEATDRLNAVFVLGGEGDPADSPKVAAAQTGEQALEFRACELLDLAGYPINW